MAPRCLYYQANVSCNNPFDLIAIAVLRCETSFRPLFDLAVFFALSNGVFLSVSVSIV